MRNLRYNESYEKEALIMAKRLKLRDRLLPRYTQGEEVMNMVTHIVGGALGILVLALCIWKADTGASRIGAVVYGVSMIALYTMSSVYHGMRPGTGKKVMQVLDHCTIYLLIAGTYTPILLTAFLPVFPGIGWGLLAMEWGLAALAVTLTAIDLKKYNAFSMVCYISLGWGILLFLPQALEVLGKPGFLWLLAGGVAYTVGAVLYGIGSKKPWFHSVFHIFVVVGSLLQAVSICFYVL